MVEHDPEDKTLAVMLFQTLAVMLFQSFEVLTVTDFGKEVVWNKFLYHH